MKQRYLLESEIKYSKAERNAFLERLKSFGNFKNEIYRSQKLKEISQQLGEMIGDAETFTVNETADWFDETTVSRDMKRMRESFKLFEKTCAEVTVLQQRLESCYDDIGSGLNKYYDMGGDELTENRKRSKKRILESDKPGYPLYIYPSIVRDRDLHQQIRELLDDEGIEYTWEANRGAYEIDGDKLDSQDELEREFKRRKIRAQISND